ncbi:MAG: cyclic nucleotide-binding domain-containing protein [Candidatus Promineifilaceae bacterium]|nr:cyclic nucleotide-binding domain-containing protein [Candidatus Promineifilaceae bacterium]
MISPETLRRYPFFNFMTPDQLREIAVITEEVEADADSTIFEMGAPADALYFVQEGGVDLIYVVSDTLKTRITQEFRIGSINAGEILGISALVEPHELTAAAETTAHSRLLRIDAPALRRLIEKDPALAYRLQQRVSRALMERLQATRVELLAATNAVP